MNDRKDVWNDFCLHIRQLLRYGGLTPIEYSRSYEFFNIFYRSAMDPVYFSDASWIKAARSFFHLMIEGVWMYIMWPAS